MLDQPWPLQQPVNVPASLEAVNQLISQVHESWDEDLIRLVFERESTNSVTCTPINRFDPQGRDKAIWMREKNGRSSAGQLD